jgi:hypothetical protein
LASSFLPQAIKVATTVAARAMRPSVRLLIMGVISVVEGVFGLERVFSDRHRIGNEKPY